MTEAIDKSPWLDNAGLVNTHTPCDFCDYDLHTLAASGRCPECGAAVAKSLPPRHVALQDTRWLRSINRAAGVVLTGLVLAGVCAVAVAGPVVGFAVAILGATAGVLWVAALKPPMAVRGGVLLQQIGFVSQTIAGAMSLLIAAFAVIQASAWAGSTSLLGMTIFLVGICQAGAAIAILTYASRLLALARMKGLTRMARGATYLLGLWLVLALVSLAIGLGQYHDAFQYAACGLALLTLVAPIYLIVFLARLTIKVSATLEMIAKDADPSSTSEFDQ